MRRSRVSCCGWPASRGACSTTGAPTGAFPMALRSRRLRTRIGAGLSHHAAGWGTNVSLGFMLGMAPQIGRFTGLPVDVRHVTLNTGIVSLAAAGGGVESGGLRWMLLAVSGIAVMFVLNLSVVAASS